MNLKFCKCLTNCSIQSGIQGPEHPHPGRPYSAIGFPRVAYLPNNAKGKKVYSMSPFVDTYYFQKEEL